MSGSRPISGKPDHAPGYRGIRFNWDWITRPLFGGALAAITFAAITGGRPYVAMFGAVLGIAAAREWHRMVGERVFGPAFFIASIVIVAALTAAVLLPQPYIAWAVLIAGAVATGAYAASVGLHAFWQGFGPLYVGATALCLVLLEGAPNGPWIMAEMFIAVWATDTGALVVGNLVGGPRLWPALSPNKTWAGTLGGIALAAIAEAVFVRFIGSPTIVPPALLGAAIGVVAVAGDLFESWVKRRFQRKDSGGMIPGHGGVLDRIDSTLFVAPVLTLFVLTVGFSPFFGALL